MSEGSLEQTWAEVRRCLARARALVPEEGDTARKLTNHDDYLGHNELELALDVLVDIEEGTQFRPPAPFWEALQEAASLMGLKDRVESLGRERIGAERGYIRVRLKVTPTAAGGRKHPVFSGYRPNWDIGNLYEGKPTLNDAMVAVDYAPHLEPGTEGVVRLHPLSPDLWKHVHPDQQIKMQEGSRVVGEGVVLDVVAPASPADTEER